VLENNLFSVAHIKKTPVIPALPFFYVKKEILGEKYALSLVFTDKKTSKKMHSEWKGKEGPANILSFPLEENLGEIFIDKENAKTECKKFNYNFTNYLMFLFIHGCCHLKGMTHGSKMEKEEKKWRKKFEVNYLK
jgi:probable rRNA maturation factor